MTIKNWYKDNFEASLSGRYMTVNHVKKLLDFYSDFFEIEVAGTSEEGVEIPVVRFGTGPKKVLVWSQMHGNESTTTKAIFDFFKLVAMPFTFQKQVELLLKTYSFTIIPILNPDGALLNTRENANKVDLNRDARDLSQEESKVLRRLFDEFKPDLCLNMHDQRSIFGLDGQYPAALSFLAPAANKRRTLTAARKEAITYIDKSIVGLQSLIAFNMGRFDDSYNANCVGDAFATAGIPTILFEAGHAPGDYEREVSRSYVFYALAAMFDISKVYKDHTALDYFSIPENEKLYNDMVLNNVYISKENPCGQICLQYSEVLKGDKVVFELVVDGVYDITAKLGHKSFNLKGARILMNSQEKIHIGLKVVSIFDERNNLLLI